MSHNTKRQTSVKCSVKHLNNIWRGSYDRKKEAQSVSGREGRALTLVCWSPAVLCPTASWARASGEAAALALLTRLSATQQLRAINPAPDVPPPRDGAPAHSHSLPSALLAFLQTSEYQTWVLSERRRRSPVPSLQSWLSESKAAHSDGAAGGDSRRTWRRTGPAEETSIRREVAAVKAMILF